MSAGARIPRQLFPVVPIPPNGDDYGAVLQWQDSSTGFTEESVFTGVEHADWRRFEWGFVPEAQPSLESLENDSIIQNILRFSRELIQKSIPTTQSNSNDVLTASGMVDSQHNAESDSSTNERPRKPRPTSNRGRINLRRRDQGNENRDSEDKSNSNEGDGNRDFEVFESFREKYFACPYRKFDSNWNYGVHDCDAGWEEISRLK